jgi:parvulin-like peptidyl-prolyl isomerase
VVVRPIWIIALASCAGAGEPSSRGPDTDAPAAKTSSAADKCLADAAVSSDKKPDEPTSVTVKHILVKHRESERADPAITRTRGEACLRAAEALEKMKGGAEFDVLVGEYSDEAGAESRAGMLGEIKREDVDPAFADAAFALDVSQVSPVVESKFGFHIILRSE